MEEEEATNKRDPWPTEFFDCYSGGTSLCLWGFLCPFCLYLQGENYSSKMKNSSENPMREPPFQQYSPWSCRGIDCSHLILFTCFGLGCCCYGGLLGADRHWKEYGRHKFEYYCSSQPCCCADYFLVEDCLIGYFCCCCSIIQVSMINDECFRMQSQVEGGVNIKGAH